MKNTDYIRIENFKKKLKNELKPERYEHTLRTVNMAMELSVGQSVDLEKIFVASLLHDCAKYRVPTEEQKKKLGDVAEHPNIVHAFFGAIIANEEYGINDETVLNCIKYHTTGRPGMTKEEMIVFLADAIEEGREYPNLKNIKEATEKSLENGVLTSLKGTVDFETSRNNQIYHLTYETINYLENLNG